MECKEVGVKFENQPKIYSFKPNALNLKVGDFVVVETARGLELGRVATPVKDIIIADKNNSVTNQDVETSKKNKESKSFKRQGKTGKYQTPEQFQKQEIVQPNTENIAKTTQITRITQQEYAVLKPILHVASKNEIQKAAENKEIVKDYIKKTKKYIRNLKLDMKLVNAELTLDCGKIIISFTSEKRVDFRELVKILASDFKMKIELRQIGSRDEVKIMGGMGVCGRPCCCCKNTGDFEHVNIKMAKLQGLSLNPSNISGLCGRLLCCLSYENKLYADTYKKMPMIGSLVVTPEGKAEVLFNNLIKETVQVKLGDSYREFRLDQLQVLKPNSPAETENSNLEI